MDSESNLKWNPYLPGYFTNPYPYFKVWRTKNPVQNIFKDSYFFFKYSDINSILKEKEFNVHSLSDYLREKEGYIFKTSENTCPYLSKGTQLWPMYLNGKLHRQIRVAITKAFHRLYLDDVMLKAIHKTNTLFKDEKSFNLVDYCGRFIDFIIRSIFNIDDSSDYSQLKAFSNLLAKSQDLYTPKQVYKKINAEIINNKTLFDGSEFKDSFLSHVNDLELNADEIYSAMLISFMAAFETSKDNLSLGLLEILSKKDLVNFTLEADKKQLKVLLEEILRFTSPLQYTIRINTRPIVYGEYQIPINSKLYLAIASANRDGDVFKDPNKLIPDRMPNPHLSFGSGAHLCLGASIARKEMELCLNEMISFLKDFVPRDVVWTKQIFMRTAKKITISQ